VSEVRCPACGAANPASNRFCGSCGSPLGGAVAPAVELEERKVVTMLFADLTASTEMASRLDPEDLRAVLRPFFDAMGREIDRHGGTVEKFIGDAVVAAFGAPVAHEDDPERAIACALAMHDRLAELNAELSERAGGDLAMRIGINTGDVIAHAVEEGIVTGEAVNIAARLQALAPPGGVVVGERTYRRTTRAFAFEDLGDVTVRGVDRPLRVFQVVGRATPPRDGHGAVEAPFVGRAGELDLLRLLFERTVRESSPNLVTVAGPPGIGKSRLTDELARALDPRARIVRGRCLPYGDGLTYWPLAEILRSDAQILDSDPADEVRRKTRERIEPRFPGEEAMGTTAVLLSSIGVEQPSDPLAGTEREAAQRLIAGAWQRYLEALAADGPLVALLEDLHWADPGLLELVEAVAARATGPLLLLCMSRPDLFERRPDWGGGLSNATTLSLSPLSASDGTELIERLLDGPAPAEVVGPILHRSEGNPFFAGELLRMMVEDGTIARRGGRWALVRELPSTLPDTVQGVIASRIDLLALQEKRAIADAAVIGRTFWAAGVERLGTPDAERTIDALVAKGLVRERDASSIQGQREFIFNHVLTRDVAYASIPRARRTQAHAAVGAWIEEGTRGRAEEFAEILAYHFAEAGDPERTARYGLLAGQRLHRVFAAEEAISWFDRAMAAAGSAGPALRSRIALARGGACEQLGRFEEADADYERSLGEARDAGDAEGEARALAAIAHVYWLVDRYAEGQELLPTALERARAVGLADVEARLLYTAGTYRFGRGEFAEALPLHREALAVAEASGDLEGQALAHHGLCESYFFQGPFEAGLDHGERADRLLRELGQRSMVAHNAYMLAWLLTFVGRLDEGLAMVEASIATSREIGNRREEGFALYDRAELALSMGRIGDALADAELGTEIFRELGLARGEIVGLNVVNDILVECWALDRLREHSKAAVTRCGTLGGTFQRSLVLGHAGWAALADRDRAGAERLFARARELDDAVLDVVWSTRIEILAWERAADPDGLAAAGARIAQRLDGSNDFWGGWGSYGLGLSALLGDDAEGALPHARDALGAAERAGERRLAWRAGRVVWRALERLGRPEEAEAHRADATRLVRAQAEATPAELRETFLARPDVADLLG
jgi:class 3 adenylate cyclase/tetratricopeptide (TPR) repeat protein